MRFVELAALVTAEAVHDAVARTYGLSAGFAEAADLALALALRSGLLVLDNCEHLVAEAASLVREVLQLCPSLAVLATSRRPLDIAGENAIALSTLDTHAATALFAERAREVDEHFTLDASSAPIVAEICRRLDGIALAIEIAARRTRVLSVHEIGRRLDTRFRLLINDRARVDRQRTLETLVAWSYDLLRPRERAFYDRLSVFPDGFTLEAACVVALDDGDEYEALDMLETLVTNSLVVRASVAGGTTRFRFLETLRAYGIERLDESSTAPLVRRRLFAYVDALFAAGGAAYEREARIATLARLDVERQTFAAALDATLHLDAPEAGARLFARVPALRRWMRDDDIATRAAAFIAALAASTPQSYALLATLEIRLGNARSRIDAPRSLPAFERAVAHARASDDSAVLGRALVAYALGLMRVRRFDEARIAIDESHGCESSLEADKERRHTRALLALYRGEGEVAAEAFAEIARAERMLGNDAFEFDALHSLAEANVVCGALDAALEAADAAEPLVDSVGPHFKAAFRSSRAAYAALGRRRTAGRCVRARSARDRAARQRLAARAPSCGISMRGRRSIRKRRTSRRGARAIAFARTRSPATRPSASPASGSRRSSRRNSTQRTFARCSWRARARATMRCSRCFRRR